MKIIIFIVALALTACSTLHPSLNSQFAPITNASSYDCVHSAPMAGCKIEGKLVLTDPTRNLTYVLYRPEDTGKEHPVPCTLPAQAAEALGHSGSFGLSVPVGAASVGAKVGEAETSQVVPLGNNAAPALYILAANFSLCLAYGFGAIDAPTYSQNMTKLIDNAKPSAPLPPAPKPTCRRECELQ